MQGDEKRGNADLGLRHVKVENASLPRIEIFCSGARSEDISVAVGYGIEEEGLPYQIRFGDYTRTDACDAAHSAGLGVAALVAEGNVSVFARQLQEQRPLFDYFVTEMETAKAIGKNAARIIKNKPFIDLDEIERSKGLSVV